MNVTKVQVNPVLLSIDSDAKRIWGFFIVLDITPSIHEGVKSLVSL